MNRSEATVEKLVALLPDIDELEVLRLKLVGAAVPDPGKAWDSSSAFTTFDKRIVTPQAAERALDAAEEALREYVALLHTGLRPVFRSFFEGDTEECARHLIALGEQHEQAGRLVAAGKCYHSALHLSLPLLEKATQVLALRRIGRVAITIGDFQEAVSYYERSAQLAGDAGDLHAEVVARTGLGNARMWQGRWSEAERCYHEALALAEGAGSTALAMERGQIYNNLANLTTRQKRIEESEAWIERAFRLWETVSSPNDTAICHFNHAHLREAQGRWNDARRGYEAALALPVSSVVRAVLATDYGDWWLREGHFTQAEEWGRVAEEHAIAAGSPYTLGHMYQGRGNIARARGDADGFTFFEKALEIAREKKYLFLEAEILVDYALLRSQNGGVEEAQAYLERAREIFGELGAVGGVERVERELATIGAGAGDVVRVLEPTGDPMPPVAAAGD